MDEELKIRTWRASAAFSRLCKVWISKVILKTKLRICDVVVISTLLYALETWATTETEEEKLEA